MSKYSNIYDTYFFKVYRFYMPFPCAQYMLTAKPEALFNSYEKAMNWAENNKDGKNYLVIFLNGHNMASVK